MNQPRSSRPRGKPSRGPGPDSPPGKPPLRLMTTTLWEYPSQHYDQWVDEDGKVHRYGDGLRAAGAARAKDAAPTSYAMQGDQAYAGATPSWVIWQCLMRYTRPGDLVVDPFCGSGTTIDVARDLDRRALGYDLAPSRPDIFRADARKLPLEEAKADFVFFDPPYSTHITYSDDPRCIGKLDSGGQDAGAAYYDAMAKAIDEIHRVLKDRRYAALYVSDSWRKTSKPQPFSPIGFELFALLRRRFKPVDIIAVVRRNQKLSRGNWHKAAEEGNFFLRGFNYLFIVKKESVAAPEGPRQR